MLIALENVVVSAVFPHNLPLNVIAEAGAQPRKFPGIIVRFARPAAALLVFETGKVICTGAKSTEEAEFAIRKFVEVLRMKGVNVEQPKVTVVNVVVSANLHRSINVEKLAADMKLSYEPERFPGAIIKHEGKTILVFSSGRIVCVGSKTLDEARQTINLISSALGEAGKTS
ncbi:MAG: TATA box-binding protein [Candidatus Bathyarchaeia archaeon]